MHSNVKNIVEAFRTYSECDMLPGCNGGVSSLLRQMSEAADLLEKMPERPDLDAEIARLKGQLKEALGVEWYLADSELRKRAAAAPPVPTWRPSDFLVGVGCIVKRAHPGYTMEELRASARAAGDPDDICDKAFAEINAIKGRPQVLVTKRLPGASHGVGMYSLPGGNLEGRDGTPVTGACRELWEETGLRALSGNLLSHCEPGVRNDGQPYITVYVEFDVDNPATGIDMTTLSNPEPDKHADWKWFDADDLPTPMWSRDFVREAILGMAPKRWRDVMYPALSWGSYGWMSETKNDPSVDAVYRAVFGHGRDDD